MQTLGPPPDLQTQHRPLIGLPAIRMQESFRCFLWTQKKARPGRWGGSCTSTCFPRSIGLCHLDFNRLMPCTRNK